MPQQGWSKKRERQYEHIKDGLEDKGKPEEVAKEKLTFDKAMIGSCTNGSYDDLLSAALVAIAVVISVLMLTVLRVVGGAHQPVAHARRAAERAVQPGQVDHLDDGRHTAALLADQPGGRAPAA